MRIVSLLPSATEILFAIGAGDEVVAVTHECDFPPATRQLPRITASIYDQDGKTCADIDCHIKQAVHEGSSIYRLDESMLFELQPDLIVTQELCEVCAVSYREVGRAVRAIASDVAVVSLEPHSIDDILATVLAVGSRTDHGLEARDAVNRLQSRLDAVRRLPNVANPPRVVCVEWTDPLMVGGHWVPEMVALAGAVDPLGVAHQPSRWVEADEIRRAAPKIVILMPCGFGLERTVRIGEDLVRGAGPPAWFGNARVVAVDGSSYFNRPGPRIVDGVELLEGTMAHTRPRAELTPSTEREDGRTVGLCVSCSFGRRIRGARTSFVMCERSQTDPSFPRYPRLPVRTCAGYKLQSDREHSDGI
jgi:iron complex transport system substrate-binding protein